MAGSFVRDREGDFGSVQANKKSPEGADDIHKPDVLRRTIEATLKAAKDKNEKNNVTILAVNVFGGSFDASAEWRRRARFACSPHSSSRVIVLKTRTPSDITLQRSKMLKKDLGLSN